MLFIKMGLSPFSKKKKKKLDKREKYELSFDKWESWWNGKDCLGMRDKDGVGFKKKSAGAIYRQNIKPILIWSSMENKIYIGF